MGDHQRDNDYPFDLQGPPFGKFASKSQRPIQKDFWALQRQGVQYAPQYAVAGRQEMANARGIRSQMGSALGWNNATPATGAAVASMRAGMDYPGMYTQAQQAFQGQRASLRDQWAAMQQRKRNWDLQLQQLQVSAENIAAANAQAKATAGL